MQHSATTSGAFISRLRRGWIFLERTRVLSGIQFTRHFIEFVVVETKELVCSNINVILTRQTCDQHSGISICKSNRRALACCFSERLCYMFLISKYRESDLGLRTISGSKKNAAAGWRLQIKKSFSSKIRRKSALRSGNLFASPDVGSDRDFPLHFDSQYTYQIRTGKTTASARRLLPAAMLERWPQVCRIKITFTLLPFFFSF